MGGFKKSAAEAVERVKTTADDAASGVKKAGSQARAEVVKLADRISGRARRRNRARTVAIVLTALAVVAGVAALQLRERRRRWL